MKKLTVVAVLLLVLHGFVGFGHGQAEAGPVTLWTVALSNTPGNNRVEVDSQDNIIVSDWDGTLFKLAKLTPEGQVMWSINSPYTYYPQIAVDASDNILTISEYSMLTKYSPAGDIVWQKSMDFFLRAVGADSLGNIIVSGNPSTAEGSRDRTRARTDKLDSFGNLLWSVQEGLPSYATFIEPRLVEVDSSGTITVISWTNQSSSPWRHHAVTYGSDGLRHSGVTGFGLPTDSAVDGADHVILSAEVFWGGSYWVLSGILGYPGSANVYDDHPHHSYYCIDVARDGNVVLGGYRKDFNTGTFDYFIYKRGNPSWGTLYWDIPSLSHQPKDLAVDSAGFMVFAGDSKVSKMTMDFDGDGVDETGDCNDFDSGIYPGAPEIIGDSIDQDCDGDADEDGFIAQEDCDDGNISIYPGAPEVKHDGIDQDCNGYDLTIEIIKANYESNKDMLSVEATSSFGMNASLLLEGFGSMLWKDNQLKWVKSVESAGGNPGTVVVSGPEGVVSAAVDVVK